MNDCLFCKIAAGLIPSSCVYEDDEVYAFRDINPQAPTHVLVIPRRHIGSMAEISDSDSATLSACLNACRKVAENEGITETGFRVVSNCGSDACQSVHHLHFHVLGGKQLKEEM